MNDKDIRSFLNFNKYDKEGSVEGDKVYFNNGFAILKLPNEGRDYPDKGWEEHFSYADDYTKELGTYSSRGVEDILDFTDFKLNGKLLRRVIKVCGKGTLYWDGMIHYNRNHTYSWSNPLYFKGEHGEAMICPMKVIR